MSKAKPTRKELKAKLATIADYKRQLDQLHELFDKLATEIRQDPALARDAVYLGLCCCNKAKKCKARDTCYHGSPHRYDNFSCPDTYCPDGSAQKFKNIHCVAVKQ
jgi:hypothetical protein